MTTFTGPLPAGKSSNPGILRLKEMRYVADFGENLNVMVKRIGIGDERRDPKPIRSWLLPGQGRDDFIDINLVRPLKAAGSGWSGIVTIVQEVVDTPLYLDTIMHRYRAGLKV